MPTREYTTHDGFYDALIVLLGSISVYTFAADSIRNNRLSPAVSDPELPFYFDSLTEGVRYVFLPHEILNAISQGEIPDQITLRETDLGLIGSTHRLDSSSHSALLASLVESSFLRYFESHRDNIYSKFGTDHSKWPPAWNFARVVRNAFGHGGTVYFRTDRSPGAEWRGISYSPADTGRRVLFNDLGIVDLVFLMEEMDTTR